jgi:hypothetical protein
VLAPLGNSDLIRSVTLHVSAQDPTSSPGVLSLSHSPSYIISSFASLYSLTLTIPQKKKNRISPRSDLFNLNFIITGFYPNPIGGFDAVIIGILGHGDGESGEFRIHGADLQ